MKTNEEIVEAMKKARQHIVRGCNLLFNAKTDETSAYAYAIEPIIALMEKRERELLNG